MADRPRATRSSLDRLLPMPPARAPFQIERTFTAEELGRLELGLVPDSMDSHWFAFVEDDWLYIHRSWSGICRYMVKIERDPSGGARLAEAWSNMKERVTTSRDYDARLVRYLVERILGNDWPFPT